MRHCRTALSIAALLCALLTPAVRAALVSTSFTTIDVAAGQTEPLAINDAGAIVGNYKKSDTETIEYGFLRSPSGTLATIEVPGTPGVATAYGINNAGQIVGRFETKQAGRLFLRAATGGFTFFSAPGPDAVVSAISANGQIVGSVLVGGLTGHTHGFSRSAAGALTTIDVPGATDTDLTGVNRAGQIAGYFTDVDGHDHAFIRSAAGAFATFDVPGAKTTWANGINDAGTIVGSYVPSQGQGWHGFARSPAGALTLVDAPGAIETHVFGINNAGRMVGWFIRDNRVRGFVTAPTTQP